MTSCDLCRGNGKYWGTFNDKSCNKCKGSGKIEKATHKNYCTHCKDIKSERMTLKNYDMMWGDGDLICNDCGNKVRSWSSD